VNHKERKEHWVPLLVEIERELDQDVSLDALASLFGASKFHFHRAFSGSFGETPKKHVERLRLEKAAFALAVTDDAIVDVAFAVGFKNAETFSRNFKRFTGYSPSGYRQMAKAAQAERLKNVDFFASDAYELSRARFVTMPATPVLAARKIGQYARVNRDFGGDADPWRELADWARRNGIATAPLNIGIFYDDPTMTPEALTRCDVCVAVERPVEVRENEAIRCMPFAGGLYGFVSYIGTVDTIISAFRGLADEIRRSPVYTFEGGPSITIMREANVGGRVGVHRVDAGFPVKKQADKRLLAPQESS
jgi:AraC family transcriptional regulator